MENKIKSFEDWYYNTPQAENNEKRNCERAWNAACKMKDEEIEKLRSELKESEERGFSLSASVCCEDKIVAGDSGYPVCLLKEVIVKLQKENEELKKKIEEHERNPFGR